MNVTEISNNTDFKIGDRVKIAFENTNPVVPDRRGSIAALPIKGKSEYSVQIAEGPLTGRKVWINGFYLKLG